MAAETCADAIRMGSEIFQTLKKNLHDAGLSTSVGDEGGFAPPIGHPEEALDLLVEAIAKAGHEGKIKIGIDPASQSFFQNGKYNLGFKTNQDNIMDANELSDLYRRLLQKYLIVLLEDPFG